MRKGYIKLRIFDKDASVGDHDNQQMTPFFKYVFSKAISTGDEIFDKIMITSTGEDWKRIRTIVTPTFTTGKIKRMINIFKECGEISMQNFKKASANGDSVELRRIFAGYTMDAIASSAFSTKIDSHNDPENKFVLAARDVFRISINWRLFIMALFPKLLKWLRISLISPKALAFFRDVTLQIVQERKKTGE
ncbi:cytochrome P450 3A14, partial [Trichonephila clavata]